jgi:hypothetical protein
MLQKQQQAYIESHLKDFFPDENEQKENSISRTPIQINATKKQIKKMVEDMPNQEEIAEAINDKAETTLYKGASTTVDKYGLRKWGITSQDITGRATKFLGDKLSHELSNASGNIHSTTVERINEILYDSYEQGKTYQQTARLIKEQGDAGVFSQARGEMIAVREIGLAYEEGSYEPMLELKEQNPDRSVEKFWSTVGDDKVTETHTQNEEEDWVDLDFVYEATGGDDHAPGSDNPRCRCTQLYRIT